MMLVRRAFLDGQAGVAYAFLQAFYEYLIVLKTRELETAFAAQRKPAPSNSGACAMSTAAERSKVSASAPQLNV